MNFRHFALAVLALVFISAGTARAQAPAEATAAWFATVDPAKRERLTAVLVADDGPTARFGLGATRFFGGLERFAQAMSRHGFAPRGSLLLSGFMRGLPQLPEPSQGPVEPLDHATFRAHLERLHADMSAARDMLATVDRSAATRIEVDLGRAQLDPTGQGQPVTILAMARALSFVPPREATGMVHRRGPDGTMVTRPRPSYPSDSLVFAFDTADAVWLQGYSEVVLAQLDFTLAHDFEPLFDATFHAIFPRAGLPLQKYLPERTGRRGFFGDSLFDFIAAIHLTSFEVADPARRARVRERLLTIIALSRENWRLIRAETDADREWLPGPQQEGAHPIEGTDVAQAEVEAWLATLGIAEAVLEGRALVPHARLSLSARRERAERNLRSAERQVERLANNEDYASTYGEAERSAEQIAELRAARIRRARENVERARERLAALPEGGGFGMNLRRFFDEPRRFDLVLLLQGTDALPYLERGEVVSGARWNEAGRLFGRRGLWGTALWFN